MSKSTGNDANSTYDVDYQDLVVLVINDVESQPEVEANAAELRLLVRSAGVQIVDEMRVRRSFPDPAFFIGRGNAEQLGVIVRESGANVIIVGEDLTPTQQRNIESVCEVRVVDRTQLILDIFALRAHTNEGKLQVELAQLKYLLPRLTGKGTELSRIGGGSGGIATRGPGETKLETDRRRIRDRIATLDESLQQVVRHREIQRKARQRLQIFSAALVGYTSAGKSTLMNTLTGADIFVDAMLFATLDPLTRRVEYEGCPPFMLSDTVGFVSRLPHNLVAAFRATLEEVLDADFLIHVVDAGHVHLQRQVESVAQVLTELGAADKPTITAFNKCDIVSDQYSLRCRVADTPDSCYISALTGDGIDTLIDLCRQMMEHLMQTVTALIPYSAGDLLALCHERGQVIDQQYLEEGVLITAELPAELAGRIEKYKCE